LSTINEISSLVRGMSGHPRIVFDRLFEIREYTGRLVLPEEMRGWVEQKFGDRAAVESQRIVKVTNRVTLEGTLFNSLRGRRPMSRGVNKLLAELVEEHRLGCTFCRAEEKTPADIFGRLHGPGVVTAANVAKYDRWHGLIIPAEHDPLHFDAGRVADYFDLAGRWIRRVLQEAAREGDAGLHYPFLLWNCLWPAGSSVVHGHLQVTVTEGGHYPRIEQLRRAAAAYRERYAANYFEDLFLVHRSLGLVSEEKEARIFASLTPVKEKEIWILLPGAAGAAELDNLALLGRAVGRVLVYLRETGTTSFNVAVYLPPPGPAPESWAGFPLLARVVDRGDALGRTADFGGMELYAASVVATDPFLLAGQMREHLGAE